MRAQPQTKTRAHHRGGEQQPPARARLPLRQERPTRSEHAQAAHRAAREARQAATLTLPADAGLTLPRLERIQAHFRINNEEENAAGVALKLHDAGIVRETDDTDLGPSGIIQNALTRNLGDGLSFPNLELEFRLIRQESTGCCHLLVFVERSVLIDFDPVARQLDKIHPQLGPSILGYVYRTLDLTPAFTPEVTFDFIRMHVWYGEEDDSALLEQARDELSHQYDGNENAFTEEDVRDYAENHYLTVRQVNERLEPRYQEKGTLTLTECRRLCEQHPQALKLITALEALGWHSRALPDSDQGAYAEMEGEMPFSLIITVGEGHSLVQEIYGELEDMIYQSGIDFLPTYTLAFDPDDPASLESLRDALVTCRGILEQTNLLCFALEDFA